MFLSLIMIIRLYVLIEILTMLPLILPITIMYYCAVDTFTPNPKHDSVYGWIYAEFLEHFVLPFTLIIALLTIPMMFPLIFMFLVLYFYGVVLGEIKSMIDYVKVIALLISFAFLLWFPDITLYVNLLTSKGWLFIIAVTLISTVSYFIMKLFRSKEHWKSIDIVPVSQFLRGYFMVCAGVIACLIVLLM